MGDEEKGAAALLLPAASSAAASCYRDEGCPGCAQDRRKESSGGQIPCKELFFVGITTRSPLCSVIFSTLFGLSTEYWMAISTRFVLGSLNGLLAPIKINTAWGLGLVIGPALGGYLAQPAEKYPQTFSKESLFGRFPYFLPSQGVSLFAAIVLILSCIWMPETMHKHKNPEKDIQIVKGLPSDCDSPRKKSLLHNWPWMSTMVSYCFFALHDTAYSEILSLWAVSDRKYGGLSFSSEDIGAVLAVAGASLLVYQLVLYHWVHKLLGPVISSRVASITSGTGICLLQNNAVRQEQRGTANGISTTAMSFFKAIAPIGAGILFSWTQKHQDSTFFPV
ncbi:hypothetical protein ACQ4PT_057858 [Festuca glaucescens]